MQASKTAMSAEVDALNVKLQDVVKFIESNNTKAAEVEEKLKLMTTWCRENHLESIPARVTATEARSTEIVASIDQRFRELSSEISITRSAMGSGGTTESAAHVRTCRRGLVALLENLCPSRSDAWRGWRWSVGRRP